MKYLNIDIETFSSEPLAKCGVYRYAEAKDFEIYSVKHVPNLKSYGLKFVDNDSRGNDASYYYTGDSCDEDFIKMAIQDKSLKCLYVDVALNGGGAHLNLETAYKDGSNIEARNNMQHAAYYAGIAFTRAYVGYVHAVAHSLGAQYHIAHGLANAVILPYFLDEYGKKAYKPLSELADAVGIQGATREEKAKKFIEAVKQMNKDMNIPEHFPEIKEEDIPIMSKHANSEGNPLYPVPKLMDRKELAEMYKKIKG